MVELQEIFDVKYGSNLELNKLKKSENGINFVSRTAKNNGVSAIVELIPEKKPINAGVITVSGGGTVLEAFLQPEPFYSGRDLYYLEPKLELTTAQKLFYCVCIRANKYKYSYGRQANRTLKYLKVPHFNDFPSWVNHVDLSKFDGADSAVAPHTKINLEPHLWKPFKYQDIFEIERGRGPRKKDLDGSGDTPFITSSDSNNGFTNYTTWDPIHKGNTIGVNRNGSVGEAFYQPEPFCSTEDVHIFTPKFEGFDKFVGLFISTLIKREKYRYSYGRKWGIARMKSSIINLPINKDGKIDCEYMRNFIKSLPYSSSL